MVKNTDFVAASSYIRTQEKHIVDSGKLEALLSLNSFEETLSGLSQGTNYQFAQTKNMEQVEEQLQKERARVYNMAYRISPQKEVVDLLTCKFDFSLIKRAVKATTIGMDISSLEQGMAQIKVDQLEQEVKNSGSSDLKPFYKTVLAETLEHYGEAGSGKQDIYLDKKMFEHMSILAGTIDSTVIKDHVKMQIDFYNIRTMMRARQMKKDLAFFEFCFVDGGKISKDVFLRDYSIPVSAIATDFTFKYCSKEVQRGIDGFLTSGNYSELELLLNNALLEQVRKAKYISFGPEVLYAYLQAKENEFRQVRILLTCKSKGIAGEILKRKLGESYA